MSPEEARRRLARSKLSKRQSYGRKVQIVEADVRYRKALECAEAGMTLDETAQAIGLTRAGLLSALQRKTGSHTWPPKTGESA